MAAAMALAARIAVNAPLAVFEAKKCVDEFVTDFSDPTNFSLSASRMRKLALTPDFEEGLVTQHFVISLSVPGIAWILQHDRLVPFGYFVRHVAHLDISFDT
jgi:hypothetical protein